ncbi:hypothetical protein [Desulfovirgula thermocuniculi]|uniref:hypothetical protein n=1 Tax=Desulfovirgula thermocuniculi TaxID=348842 RepID=UPI0003F9A6F1|nr:hypothetical protein [Desulfovirgula thermocuniculi]
MRILSNIEKQFKAKGAEFVLFDGGADEKVDAAVVVRGPKFSESLFAAAEAGVPVVVVAGTEDGAGRECIRAAEECGVPPECVLVLRGGMVVDLDGREVAPAVRGGVGLGAVLAAVRHAVENNLLPEPVVWAPEMDPGEQCDAIWTPEQQAAGLPETVGSSCASAGPAGESTSGSTRPEEDGTGQGAVPAGVEGAPAVPEEPIATEGGVLLPLMERAKKVIVLFQSCPGADSSSVAAGLVKAVGDGALHLEVGGTPVSYARYGESPDAAVAGGKYAFCDGRTVLGADRRELYECIVAEVRVPLGNPQVVDEVYRSAHRVVHVVGHSFKDATESVRNVQLWLDSEMKLRLDALVVDRVPEGSHVVELYRGNFGDRIGMIVGIEKDENFGPLAEALLRG